MRDLLARVWAVTQWVFLVVLAVYALAYLVGLTLLVLGKDLGPLSAVIML